MLGTQANSEEKFLISNEDKKNADTSALMALCLFSIIMLATYLMVLNSTTVTNEVTTFFTEISKTKNQRFQLGEIKLGSSLVSLKKSRPDSVVGVTASGQITAAYKEGSAIYTAWYGEEGPKDFSYRMRYDNTFSDTDEDAIIYEISERHGSPSTNSCNARITDGVRACKFTWWLSDGVRLEVVTRTPIKSNNKINLTIIATDTRLKSRIQRGVEGLLIKGGLIR
ncbi:MAG: hypothetical protein KAQ66_09445 [Rhodospirillaceae bacterium]|nr:hypothetical protein [Rhodospirillaceae bacterium]